MDYMRSFFSLFFITLLFSCATNQDTSSKIENNDQKFVKPNKEFISLIESLGIDGDQKLFERSATGYLLVYAPTLNDLNAFEHPLHLAGMYTYFENSEEKHVETILVSSDDKSVYNSFLEENKRTHPEFYNQLSFVHDPDKKLIELLKIDADHMAHAGIAITFDENAEEIFRQEDYKCQGEKLQRIHQHFYPREMALPATNYEIEVGNKLPPELLSYCKDYLGKKNMLITFYPAPLSHSCSIQMRTFNDIATQNLESKDLKAIAVSIGTLEQIDSWKLHQPTKSIELVADTSGAFSNSFNSLLKDDYGVIYSDRTVFLIDKEGVVRYINKDYDVAADLDVLENEIKKL